MNREQLAIMVESALDMAKDTGGGNITSDSITWENLSGCLSKLSPQASAYIRIKYLLEGHRVAPLTLSLHSKGVALCNRFGRRVCPHKLIYTALIESIGDNICRACNGVGVISNKSCPKCEGTGRKGWSNVRKAKSLGVASGNFRRDYTPLYEAARGIFDGYEQELSRALYKSAL